MKNLLFLFTLCFFSYQFALGQVVLNDVQPGMGFQGETLTVTIVGNGTLNTGSGTINSYLYMQVGSNSAILPSGPLSPDNSGNNPAIPNGMSGWLADFAIPASQEVGLYDLKVGSNTLSNAFYVLPDLGGSALIGGGVYQGSPKQGPGDPIKGLELTLKKDQTLEELVGETDFEGQFEFRYLTDGTYRLYGDGLDNTNPPTFEINSQNQVYEDLNLKVDSNKLVLVLGVEDHPLFQKYKVQLHPTLTNGNITLSYSLPEPQVIEVELYDISGTYVKALSNTLQPAGTNKLNLYLGDAAPGMLFVKVRIDNMEAVLKVLKTN